MTTPSLQVTWQTGTPDIPKGEEEAFWCAFQSPEGKIYHKRLMYLNAHVAPASDNMLDPEDDENCKAVGDDGEYEWTGWFESSCEQCDTFWRFMQPVVAYMKMPKYQP